MRSMRLVICGLCCWRQRQMYECMRVEPHLDTGSENAANSLRRKVSSTNNISCTTLHWRGPRTEHVGVPGKGNVAVNLDTEADLDDVVKLQQRGILWERRGVARDLVDGDAGREGNTLLALALLVHSVKLLLHELVGKGAEVRGAGAGQAERDNLRHGVIGDGCSLLVL